jgi:energy-coupling factor transporter ATP-binding protein EcfA2
MSAEDKKKKSRREEIVSALCTELKNRFKLKQGHDFMCSKEKDRFFIEPTDISENIYFSGHYETKADILVNDCLFNTLGMIYVYVEEVTRGNSTGSFPDFLKTCIDRAGYMRHLFLEDAALKNQGNSDNHKIQARCVELVIVCPGTLKEEFGNTLRDIAQKTDYLYSIGVNLLTIPEPGKKRTQKNNQEEKYFKEKDLERAFSWLLLKTRKWYEKESSASNNNAPLREITLNNYRLPGKRIFNLDPNRNVHLVHGHNGSGKSTIVEALEIVVTGKSERLGNIPNYDEVIKNIYSSDPAYVVLRFEGKDELIFQIEKDGVSDPLDKKLKAASFRMDQAVMERLTRAGNGERANVFIDAFFPGDREVVEKYNAARNEAGKYFEKLPQNLQDSIKSKKMNREDAVIDFLSVLEKEAIETPIELIEACLPLSLESLRILAPLSSVLPGALGSLTSGLINEKVLTSIDGALKEIMDDLEAILAALYEALDLLKQLNRWKVSPQYSTDFKTTLDKWLEMTALTDLAEKYYTVVKSLKEARDKKWSMDEDSKQIFEQYPFAVKDEETIREKLAMLASKRDQLRVLLEPTDIQANKEGELPAIPPILGKLETDKLDRAGDWLAYPGLRAGDWLAYPGLGKIVKEALSRNKIVKFDNSLTVGKQNWAAGLIEKTKKLIAVCQQIKNKEKFEESCIDRFRHLINTLRVYKDLKEMCEKIHTTFLKLLEKDEEGNLIEVLNELLDLFTPARWAYEDISIRHEYSDKKEHKLHFEIGETKTGQVEKARADFRLNMSELNIFALSLFVLCAVRNSNPLSLLIFDDPLQNMDEITVTTLARGLNKLIKLFPANWQIIMLFHGLEDLERFCREIPAAVYSLRWLSPLTGAEEIQIKPDILKSQVFTGVQDLNDIIEIRA